MLNRFTGSKLKWPVRLPHRSLFSPSRNLNSEFKICFRNAAAGGAEMTKRIVRFANFSWHMLELLEKLFALWQM
jgi:hypothetical protein